MDAQGTDEPDDLIDVDEAAAVLEVAPDRVQVMIDEGLLSPADGGEGQQFVRAEVVALRELGG